MYKMNKAETNFIERQSLSIVQLISNNKAKNTINDKKIQIKENSNATQLGKKQKSLSLCAC